MPHVTVDLIRKRAEHNEGLIHTLEEISLHQEELEGISECLGANCRRLKILYLQNNLISKMENLVHMKQLEYLNLALNNISKIEGLQACEFLNKLDLTVNFIDLDCLEESIDHLTSRTHLADLYLLGNACMTNWEEGKAFAYVIARLPQIQRLDGKEITRSMRITATQILPQLTLELREKAEEVRRRKAVEAVERKAKRKAAKRDKRNIAHDVDNANDGGCAEAKQTTCQAKNDDGNGDVIDDDDDDGDDDGAILCLGPEEMTQHTPEARTAIYREIAEQKKEKDERRKEMEPQQANYEAEQREAVQKARNREAEGIVRQCNEGKWDFYFDEASHPGCLVLDIGVQRFLDSSLIDLDLHPTYVSVVIKSKVLRLILPVEVKVGGSKAQRSQTTGHLLIIMPKVNSTETVGLRGSICNRGGKSMTSSSSSSASRTTRKKPAEGGGGGGSIAALMMQEAAAAAAVAAGSGSASSPSSSSKSRAVSIKNIVKQPSDTAQSALTDDGRNKAGNGFSNGPGSTTTNTTAPTPTSTTDQTSTSTKPKVQVIEEDEQSPLSPSEKKKPVVPVSTNRSNSTEAVDTSFEYAGRRHSGGASPTLASSAFQSPHKSALPEQPASTAAVSRFVDNNSPPFSPPPPPPPPPPRSTSSGGADCTELQQDDCNDAFEELD